MKNWKTTLVGCMLAVIIAVQPMIETGSVDWKKVGIAALIALFSFIVKDANVTGGTVASTPEAAARVEKKDS